VNLDHVKQAMALKVITTPNGALGAQRRLAYLDKTNEHFVAVQISPPVSD
jgi:hypothetical protein